MVVRTGIGFDVHRFAEGRRLVLGGIEIDHERGLAGHSDADVLLHAIADALLGAAGLGDIGRHYPPDDPRWKDADSVEILRDVSGRVRAEGWEVSNVDATVLAEAPRIGPHVERMVARISEAMSVQPDRVSVKATTMEGLGPIGNEEGIAAMAVATVFRNS
ncbi:MAG: 2-C-methyl-D-erythritol 2,4-cyclodiphosphate synthase [Gemmatimonadota bacterium]